ncbi:hypothetical protein EV426DRAFT_577116 [Tirmania nivea]|nr:hypothetical protein EV426DRAFT_577116 [Tirmania nivea]
MNRLLKQLEAKKKATLKKNIANTTPINQTQLSNDTAEVLNQIQRLILIEQQQQQQEFETIHNNLNWLKGLDGYYYFYYYKNYYFCYYKHYYLYYYYKYHYLQYRLDDPNDYIET